MSDNVKHFIPPFERFANDCWFAVLHNANHLFCDGKHNIMNLFHASNNLRFGGYLKLGDQLPIELLDIIFNLMSIRIRIVHANSSRFIGSSSSSDEIKNYHVLHVGSLEYETGHYTLEKSNSHESFEVYYTESEVERAEREAEREAVRQVEEFAARAEREAVRQVEEFAEREAEREAVRQVEELTARQARSRIDEERKQLIKLYMHYN